MIVKIDGQERAWEYAEGTNLQEVLIDVHQRLLTEEQRIITEIKLDETVPGLDMTLTPDQVAVDKIISLSFSTSPYREALVGYLEASQGKISEVKDSISHIVECIVADKVDMGMGRLKEGLDTLIWFFDVMQQASASGMITLDDIEIGGVKLYDFVGKFNGILNELVSAMKNNDMTLINDYLEYELEPALKDIIDGLPLIIQAVKGE